MPYILLFIYPSHGQPEAREPHAALLKPLKYGHFIEKTTISLEKVYSMALDTTV
jgi:hypothetical protein